MKSLLAPRCRRALGLFGSVLDLCGRPLTLADISSDEPFPVSHLSIFAPIQPHSFRRFVFDLRAGRSGYYIPSRSMRSRIPVHSIDVFKFRIKFANRAEVGLETLKEKAVACPVTGFR
jgi:hypothetical protein